MNLHFVIHPSDSALFAWFDRLTTPHYKSLTNRTIYCVPNLHSPQFIGGSVDWWIGGLVDRWIGGSVDRWIGGSVDRWIGELEDWERGLKKDV